MKQVLVAFLYAVALLSRPVFANEEHHKSPAVAMTDGEVRKVDKAARKITLRHGPITNLDMPGMTMVFHAKDPAMLDKVKAGDKVKFSAEKVGENFIVTKIEPAK